MRDDPVITDLVTPARDDDKQAWDAIVEQYAPLVWSICRRYRLGDAGVEDVGRAVWLDLVEHLGNLRDPAALPGWLTTATRRECCRVLRAAGKPPADEQMAENMPDEHTATAGHELVAERNIALREAFARLPLSCQRLLALLIADPAVPSTEISARLGIPIESIAPNRRWSLDVLRRDPAIVSLINAEATGGSWNSWPASGPVMKPWSSSMTCAPVRTNPGTSYGMTEQGGWRYRPAQLQAAPEQFGETAAGS
jgi:RNA polymerase sigma factor (sigma-70 family)